MLLLLLLLFFFFFFLIVLFDYSIAAAKRKLFKSEERTNIIRTCIRVLCVLYVRKRDQFILFVETIPSAKEILSPFFSPFFSSSLLQKKNF